MYFTLLVSLTRSAWEQGSTLLKFKGGPGTKKILIISSHKAKKCKKRGVEKKIPIFIRFFRVSKVVQKISRGVLLDISLS